MSLGDVREPTAFLLGCWSAWFGMGWKNKIPNSEVVLTPSDKLGLSEKEGHWGNPIVGWKCSYPQSVEKMEANSAGRCTGTAQEVMESSH